MRQEVARESVEKSDDKSKLLKSGLESPYTRSRFENWGFLRIPGQADHDSGMKPIRIIISTGSMTAPMTRSCPALLSR